MPLVKRNNPPIPKWALTAVEIGGMYVAEMPVEKIAKNMDLGVAYVATLIDLYRGYKQFPELVKIASIHTAKSTLQKWRTKEMLRNLGEMP